MAEIPAEDIGGNPASGWQNGFTRNRLFCIYLSVGFSNNLKKQFSRVCVVVNDYFCESDRRFLFSHGLGTYFSKFSFH